MKYNRKVEILIEAVLDNTHMGFTDGGNSSDSDYCSACNASATHYHNGGKPVPNKNTLASIPHDSDCPWVLANELYSEMEEEI